MPDGAQSDLPQPTLDIAIVGAGAAGLATAIFARQFAPSRSVVLLEGAPRPGAKILVSGGSRCNVTNASVTERDFWGGRSTIVRRVLRSFSAADAVAWFRRMGVALHEEADGKLFPDSNRSRDVLDALLRTTAAAGAALRANCRVSAVERDGDMFVLQTSSGGLRARVVVLATGGQSLPKSGSDGAGFAMARSFGHTIVPTTPALVPLVLDASEPLHRTLSGVSHDALLTVRRDGVVVQRLRGALLWTHFGISGPVALNASRHFLRGAVDGRTAAMELTFVPEMTFEQLDGWLLAEIRRAPTLLVRTALSSRLPQAVAAAVLAVTHIDDATTLAHLTRDDRKRLVHALVERPLPIVGSRGYTFAEATAGGVSLGEIDPATMASRLCPGLYLVGEVLDVDGRLGGFNFQWAWSSGHAAGRALAR